MPFFIARFPPRFFIQLLSSAHFMPSLLLERRGRLSSRLRQLTYVAVQWCQCTIPS
jgi:hypothetical protein